jgi:hypothetical protein
MLAVVASFASSPSTTPPRSSSINSVRRNSGSARWTCVLPQSRYLAVSSW